ncbi:MAG: transporter substrate-binding domain-containing protein [Methylococcaceae bacterium]|nr:transporter substrate-binding domain-containing protein [Methylococcaceae bacterium]
MKFKAFLLIFTFIYSFSAFATEKPVIRLGVLAFGTVNWELEALKNEGLLDTAEFELQIQKLANPQAGKIALQSGAVDMIVSDWIWVSRLRTSGEDFTFYPYSNTSGALIVPELSEVKTLQDLQGKKLGIAGGELDKNWLLLRAAAQQQSINLNDSVTKVYGAPPLLNQQLLSSRVDAVINYWHFAARLEAQGFRQLFSGKELLKSLGISEAVPSLGYVFKESWANEHKIAVNDFLNKTSLAKDKLCTMDTAWEKVISLTKAKDEKTQTKLRERYCAGRIQQWGDAEKQAAEKIYQLLRKLSNNRLTGSSESLQTGTFWAL